MILDRIRAWFTPPALNGPSIRYRKDSPVRCPRGHRVCHITADILAGERVSAAHFGSFVNGNPVAVDGEEVAACAQCGQPWINRYTDHLVFKQENQHVEVGS